MIHDLINEIIFLTLLPHSSNDIQKCENEEKKCRKSE